MVKKIKKKEKKEEETKEQQESPLKGKYPCPQTHTDQYNKQYEKSGHPRRIWPTDSENKKKKGPKI